jgi:hypothetical protein
MSEPWEPIRADGGTGTVVECVDTTPFHDFGYVVDADYNGVWALTYRPHRKEWEGSPCGEGRFWYGDRPIPTSLIEEFNAWQDRFEFAPFDRIPRGADGIDGFSWRQFHADGLRLAKRLKRELGPEYVVIYSQPWEDKTGHGPMDMLVTNDGGVVRYVHVPIAVLKEAPSQVN